MNDVVISSTPADATASQAIEQHHAELSGALTTHVSAVSGAAQRGTGVDAARADLLSWCDSVLLPHAKAEEELLYPAARTIPGARMLVEAMVTEHSVLAGLVDSLRSAADGYAAVEAASALQAIVESLLTKEDTQLLPALSASPEVSLEELLHGMHRLLGQDQPDSTAPAADAGHGHACACGEQEPEGYPELDARVVPHAIRHATIFGALDAVGPGRGMVLVAPHDPLPLLSQIEGRAPGVFEVSYLERGPEAWRLQFVRRAS